MSIPTKKVIIVGDKNLGKTRFARLYSGEFKIHDSYLPTLGVEVRPALIVAADGQRVKINIWDCAGDPRFGGLRDGYWLQADLAIVFSTSYISSLQSKNIPYVMFDASKNLAEHVETII